MIPTNIQNLYEVCIRMVMLIEDYIDLDVAPSTALIQHMYGHHLANHHFQEIFCLVAL